MRIVNYNRLTRKIHEDLWNDRLTEEERINMLTVEQRTAYQFAIDILMPLLEKKKASMEKNSTITKQKQYLNGYLSGLEDAAGGLVEFIRKEMERASDADKELKEASYVEDGDSTGN